MFLHSLLEFLQYSVGLQHLIVQIHFGLVPAQNLGISCLHLSRSEDFAIMKIFFEIGQLLRNNRLFLLLAIYKRSGVAKTKLKNLGTIFITIFLLFFAIFRQPITTHGGLSLIVVFHKSEGRCVGRVLFWYLSVHWSTLKNIFYLNVVN